MCCLGSVDLEEPEVLVLIKSKLAPPRRCTQRARELVKISHMCSVIQARSVQCLQLRSLRPRAAAAAVTSRSSHHEV